MTLGVSTQCVQRLALVRIPHPAARYYTDVAQCTHTPERMVPAARDGDPVITCQTLDVVTVAGHAVYAHAPLEVPHSHCPA